VFIRTREKVRIIELGFPTSFTTPVITPKQQKEAGVTRFCISVISLRSVFGFGFFFSPVDR
jgi:hypothetical protein